MHSFLIKNCKVKIIIIFLLNENYGILVLQKNIRYLVFVGVYRLVLRPPEK